jgi:hypothetical protein
MQQTPALMSSHRVRKVILKWVAAVTRVNFAFILPRPFYFTVKQFEITIKKRVNDAAHVEHEISKIGN